MKLAICAGPATTGKTAVLRHVIKSLLKKSRRPAYFKLDIQFADDDEIVSREYSIPTRKVYSGVLCPDHCLVMVLKDVMVWGRETGSDVLLVETAGLCLRCSPYVEDGLGVIVLEATSGMNLPLKVGPMLTLADVAVVTKIDRVSQAEREVFRTRILDVAPKVRIRETNALHGIGIEPLVDMIMALPDIGETTLLRGNPPVGSCTVCTGSMEIGQKSHFGRAKTFDNGLSYEENR